MVTAPWGWDYISILTPRAGRDSQRQVDNGGDTYFNPRAPCGARHAVGILAEEQRAISILAPRTGRED